MHKLPSNENAESSENRYEVHMFYCQKCIYFLTGIKERNYLYTSLHIFLPQYNINNSNICT